MYFISTLRIIHLATLTHSCILINKFSVLERLILTYEFKRIICPLPTSWEEKQRNNYSRLILYHDISGLKSSYSATAIFWCIYF